MTKESPESAIDPEKIALLGRVFEGLPSEGRYELLRELRRIFHEHLAKSLEPIVNHHIHSTLVDAFADRKRLAGWVDRVTAELGVTPADPETGRPGLLVAERIKFRANTSHFCLLLPVARDGFMRYRFGEQLPDQKLVPMPSRLGKWYEEYRSPSSGGKNRGI